MSRKERHSTSWLVALGSAPRASSAFTAATWPLADAMCSAVSPLVSTCGAAAQGGDG